MTCRKELIGLKEMVLGKSPVSHFARLKSNQCDHRFIKRAAKKPSMPDKEGSSLGM